MKKYRIYIIIALIILAMCVTVCFIPIGASKFIPVVEKQFEEDLGVKVHIDKLIFRFGPSLKIKAPIMHIMYEDGQKFAQLDNVKLFINWSAVFKDDVNVNRIYADKIIVKTQSTDKFLKPLLDKISDKDYKDYPNLQFKNYSIKYKLVKNNKDYEIRGYNLNIAKLESYKNLKLETDGEFLINDKNYINYNLSVTPNIEFDKEQKTNFNLNEFVEQIENLDFHSDIMADLKLYGNNEKELQMSGLVNLDNMSVLDSDKKNPKSFIYLTFLGNKVGIISNIYTSQDKKIFIEGMINNSKKPEVDLKVKADEILLVDMYKKIKLLVDCSKYKGMELIAGKLNADFNIKGDLNKLKSTGYLKVSDASIKSNGISMHNINSDIDFSNNMINITNAIGYVNNAPIMIKGQVKKDIDIQLLMDKVEIKHLFPESIGIENGLISLDAKLTGTSDNIVHKENIHIDKFKASKDKNTLSFDSLNINTNKDNIALISNIVIKPELTENIKIPTLKLIIDGDRINVNNANIFMPNSKLKANAEVTDFSSKNPLFHLNINGFINSKDLSGITKLSSVYPVKFNLQGNKEAQNVEAQVQIVNALILDEPSLINFAGKIEKNNLKIEDLSILPFDDNFTNNLKSNVKGSKKLIISGIIENLAEPVLKNIRIFVPQQLNLSINDTIAQIKGDLFVNGSLKQPEIVGQVSASNIINQFIQLAINNSTIDFNKNIAIINAPVVKLGDSSAGINATLLTDFSNGVVLKNASIKSKYLNTDTILLFKNNPIYADYKIKVQDGKFYAERATATVFDGQVYLGALNGEFKLDNNKLNIKNISADMYNGKIAGSIDFDLNSDNFEAKMQAREVSASPVFDLITTKKDALSGAMDFDADVKGNLNSKQSVNGDIKFIVRNGHLGTLGKLEHLLYAQNVISDSMLRTTLGTITKAITLKDTGLFKYLRGDINMANGVANINLLQSQGPLMSMYIKGQYNPITDYAKLNILGRISDEIVDSLGAFGDFSFNKLMVMLTGEENNAKTLVDDIDKLPPLQARNTREFKAVINGILEKPSSVIRFNWVSYTQKSLKQKEVPMTNTKLPDFLEALPY